MTVPNPQIEMALLFKQRLDAFESRISVLEVQARLQVSDSDFSQRFEALILELRNQQPPTSP